MSRTRSRFAPKKSPATGGFGLEAVFQDSQHAEWALQLGINAEVLAPQARHDRAVAIAVAYAGPA
ncbi:hypothetical protein [Amycolatopsis echigonensis]|uniref:Uncharacterized protein n=1 Tax=Amycolatopsis echigonensis TaxID=2576905 RepID=A0A8E1W1U8_9PSEU|nr:hypothetical protein [Amycolatopsis echigonensis]MBB2502258.1 hypothetical protein [Amycolatopsis echigonensis]